MNRNRQKCSSRMKLKSDISKKNDFQVSSASRSCELSAATLPSTTETMRRMIPWKRQAGNSFMETSSVPLPIK